MTGGSSSGGMINRNRSITFSSLSGSGMLIAFIITCVILTGCKNDPKEIDELLNRNSLEDKAEDVVIIYSEEGSVKVRMFATEFVRNDIAKPPYTEMRKGLRVEFFNDSLQIESTLDAQYGRYYEEKGNILIRDSVVVVNVKGDTLRTEELIWSQKVRKIYSEKFVRINTPDQIMYGDGLEANEDFSWYRIKNPKGIVKVNKEEMPE